MMSKVSVCGYKTTNIKHGPKNVCGAMHYIYYINRLTATKVN